MVLSEYLILYLLGYHCTVDVLSSIEFDDTGDYIAVGDRGGRVVIFEREDKVNITDFNTSLNISYLHCLQS